MHATRDFFVHPEKFQRAFDNVGGFNLVVAFLAGVSLYLYRDRIRWDLRIFGGTLIASMLLLAIPGGEYIAVFPAAYVTVYLGLLNPRKNVLIQGADYSYGLYLYGMVIEQALAAVGVRQWYSITALTLLLGTLFAAASWRWVEKPALEARHPLQRFEELMLRKFASAGFGAVGPKSAASFASASPTQTNNIAAGRHSSLHEADTALAANPASGGEPPGVRLADQGDGVLDVAAA
jgi:hypothetical protein